MKVHMLRTVGRKDAGKFGIDLDKLSEYREGEEVDCKKEIGDKLIEHRLAVTPESVEAETFVATPPQPMRAVSSQPAQPAKDNKDKK